MTRKDRFIHLYQPVSERLERFALFLERNRDGARELVCETVASAFEHLDGLRDDQAFLGWLFSICHRRHQSMRRRDSRYVEMESLDELLGPADPAFSRHDVELLYRAINNLPEKEREAVLLAEIFGLPHAEIAKIQGTTSYNVKTRVHRARKSLRVMLAENTQGPEAEVQRRTYPVL